MTRFFSNVESESECSRRSMNAISANVVSGWIMNLGMSQSLLVFALGGIGGGLLPVSVTTGLVTGVVESDISCV